MLLSFCLCVSFRPLPFQSRIFLSLCLLASSFHTLPHRIIRTLESGHYLCQAFVCWSNECPALSSSSLLSFHFCPLTLSALLCCNPLSKHLHSWQLFTNEARKDSKETTRRLPRTYEARLLRMEEWWQLWLWPMSSTGQSSARASASLQPPYRSPLTGYPASGLPARRSRTPPPGWKTKQKQSIYPRPRIFRVLQN